MDQEFYYNQSMPTNNTASDEETKTEDDVKVDNNNNIRTDEVNEDNQVPQLMNGAHVNDMYTQFPVQCEYCMRTFGDDFRRPPMHESQHGGHHGGHGRPRPGFHGSGGPFLGGLASGLLVGSLFPPYGGYPYGGYGGFGGFPGGYGGYGGYYQPYYYQQPPYYYPY